jgi:hypothetical protein
MQRLDLVSQARTYMSQAKQTINMRKKARLLTMAQRLLAMDAKGSDNIILVSPFEPWPRRRRGAMPLDHGAGAKLDV